MSEKKRTNPVTIYFKRNFGTIIGLIILCVIVSIATPKFLTGSNILNLFKSNAVNAIITCGMLMAILMGEIDISVGSIVGLTGVTAAFLLTNKGVPVPLVVVLILLLGALIGAVNGFFIAYVHVPAFVATLATQSIGRGLTEIITNGVTIRIRNDLYTSLGNKNLGAVSILSFNSVCTRNSAARGAG